MWTTSPSVPASPQSSRDVKRTEYSGSVTEPAAVRLDVVDLSRVVHAHDGAALALGVAGRAGVTRGMPLAHLHRVADREPRRGPRRQIDGQNAAVGPRQREMAARAAIKFLRRRHARLDRERGDPGEPVLPVRRRQVMRGIHPLDRMAKHASVDAERSERSDHHPKGAPLPVRGEERLDVLVLDRAETVQPAEVMHAVHVGIIRISGPTPIHFPRSGDIRFNRSEGRLADIHLPAAAT